MNTLKDKKLETIGWEDTSDLLTSSGQVYDCFIYVYFTDNTSISILPDVDGDFNQVLFDEDSNVENTTYIFDDEGGLIVSEEVYSNITEIQEEIFEKAKVEENGRN